MDNLSLVSILCLAFLAGIAIPVGGLFATMDNFMPKWLENEFRHSVIAFGGGALLGAIALVLVPQGITHLSPSLSIIAFLIGGFAFCLVDIVISKTGGSGSQLIAMLLDFLPEAAALGATFAIGKGGGLLLAFLIAIQNLPEGFNAFHEIRNKESMSSRRLLLLFVPIALLGPIATWAGYAYLANHPQILGFIMLSASGGILYIIFQDIAPQAKLDRKWAPSLGALIGFALALTGHVIEKQI